MYWYTILSIPVYDFVNNGKWFENVCNKDMHYLYVCIAKFEDSDIWFCQYCYMIFPIPVYWLAIPVCDFSNMVYNFANTRLRFGHTGEGTLTKIWAGLRSKSKSILWNMEVLEICIDMWSRTKQNRFCYKCPFRGASWACKRYYLNKNVLWIDLNNKKWVNICK